MEPSWINDWLDQPQPPLPMQTPDPRVWAAIQARVSPSEPSVSYRWVWMTAAGFALLLGLNMYLLQWRQQVQNAAPDQDPYAATLTVESQNDLYP